MCVAGAREVFSKVIRRIPHDDLSVLVIWTPRYPGDNRSKAVLATQHVPGSRATHYWDGDGTLPKVYGRVLGLPAGKQFAWDTYMVFDADAEWTTTAPKPNNWMHQMSRALGRSHPRWLDSDRFRESIQSLLDDGPR